MTLIIVSPSCTADSAKDLANRLGLGWYRNNKEDCAIFGENTKIINWGCSRIDGNVVLNQTRAVRRSLNKLRTFELLSEKIRMPVMTQDRAIAVGWAEDGRKVVCRNRIKGSKSKGITITSDPTEVAEVPAKFFTRFIANCSEFRVNVYKGKILTVYWKKPAGNDFTFKIQLHKEEEFQSKLQDFITAVDENIGLDMYGLDMLHTPKGKWFLLEVNSAPILFPITYKRLAKVIEQDLLQNG